MMKLCFKEEGHIYESDPPIAWTSVTRLIQNYHEHFDDTSMALQSSQKPISKWFGIDPDKILAIWKEENTRSTDAGHWVHAKYEKAIISKPTKLYRGRDLPVFPPQVVNGVKLAPRQQLVEGVYPEHFVYSEELEVCGQSDVVVVMDGFVHILDYKTNKKLEMQSYGGRFGNPTFMYGPIDHLEDCNFVHYVIQLGIYMRLILLKNPNLKPGTITICHITMAVAGYDSHGFPILTRTKDDGYEIDKVKNYNVKYLETEVRNILKHHYQKAIKIVG